MALDAEGYTILDIAEATRTIYVSSSTGSNSNDGLTDSTPKQTFAAAMALVRKGYPDWVLLKCGDVWSEDMSYKGGGPSNELRSCITSYGSGARPMIKNKRLKNNEASSGNLNIVGIELYASWADPESGDFGGGSPAAIGLQCTSVSQSNVLIEDCKISFYSTNCQLKRSPSSPGHNSNYQFRRNVILDAIKFGLGPAFIDGLTVEDNTFDRNGWAARDARVHSIYFQSNLNLVCQNNVMVRSGSHAFKCSTDSQDGFTDFLFDNNFLYKSTMGMGHSSGPSGYDPMVDYSHQRGTITNSVWMRTGKTITAGGTAAYANAIIMGNANDMEFSGNCFVQNDEYYVAGSLIGFGEDYQHGTVTISDERVFDWKSKKYDNTGSYLTETESVQDLTVTNSYLQYPSEIQFADPDRDLDSYAVVRGVADAEAVLTAAAAQRKGSWNVNYTADAINDYVRAGLAGEVVSPSTITPLLAFQQVGSVVTATVSLLSRVEDDLECKIDWPNGFATLEYSLNSGSSWATYTDNTYLSFDSSDDERTVVLFRGTVSTFEGPADITATARASSLGLGNPESVTINLTLVEEVPSGFTYLKIRTVSGDLIISREEFA